MDTKEAWLKKGYELFALHGPKSLSINKIAKEIDQTRTSFYYYFNDVNNFINELIEMHVNIHDVFIKRGKKECKKYRPDLFKLLSEFPSDLKFHKQLFNYRSNPLYDFTYMQCNNKGADAFVVDRFKEYYKLNADKSILKLIHGSFQDAWFSRLDLNDITVESMVKISDEIMESILLLLNKSKSPYLF